MKKVGKIFLIILSLAYIIFPDLTDLANLAVPGLGFVDDAAVGVFMVSQLRSLFRKDDKIEEKSETTNN